MGKVSARVIRLADIARYLRVERAAALVRANREVTLPSNLMTVAVERGDVDVNPCKQVKRNRAATRRGAGSGDVRCVHRLAQHSRPAAQGHRDDGGVRCSCRVTSIEFLHLTLPQIDSQAQTIRLMRAKQHGGAVRVESVSITEKMKDLVRRLRELPRPDECLHVFTTRDGNPYTDDGFASTWQRAMASALKDKVIPRHFTFHDLRAYYTTQHKAQYAALPELHADTKTTAKVYDRSRVSERKGLK